MGLIEVLAVEPDPQSPPPSAAPPKEVGPPLSLNMDDTLKADEDGNTKRKLIQLCENHSWPTFE